MFKPTDPPKKANRFQLISESVDISEEKQKTPLGFLYTNTKANNLPKYISTIMTFVIIVSFFTGSPHLIYVDQ